MKFLIAWLFPVSVFSWSWFSTPLPPEKVDFACPHHCGQWGSESIQALEWQFVECLYEADKLQNFIKENEMAYDGRSTHYQSFEPKILSRPENFKSEWYQKMLVDYEFGRLVISNNYNCYQGWGVFWKIKHLDNADGTHLGKIFKRNKYNNCWFNGVDEDDDLDVQEAEELEHENDPDWNRCVYEDLVEKHRYSFKNRIDLNNACLQVEHDFWEELQDNSFRGLDSVISFKKEMHDRLAKLSHQLHEVINSYDHIFEECLKKHNAPSAEYDLILKQFETGNYSEAVDNLRTLINRVKLDSLEANLASNIYTSKGWAENETLQYDEAIISLSHAITLKPTNPDAYFERAIAYFEKGQFEMSLDDFLKQGKDTTFPKYEEDWWHDSFGVGLMKGGFNGVQEATTEFLPSIYNSACGVGNFLWLTIQHPIDAPKQLVGSTIDFCNYLRTCDKAELAEMLVPEMYELIDKWDELASERRGELLGYSLGKYGLDILLPVATVKGIKYVKTLNDIKKAEKLCTLQTLAKSAESKEALTQAAVKWNAQREASLANAKPVKGNQNKHLKEAKIEQPKAAIRTEPKNLLEQLALEEAKSGYGDKVAGLKVKDPNYPPEIWQKMQHQRINSDGTKTNIHFWENKQTGERTGFKFKDTDN